MTTSQSPAGKTNVTDRSLTVPIAKPSLIRHGATLRRSEERRNRTHAGVRPKNNKSSQKRINTLSFEALEIAHRLGAEHRGPRVDCSFIGATLVDERSNIAISRVSWADLCDNFTSGLVAPSGLSVSDNYSDTSVESGESFDGFASFGANTVRLPTIPPQPDRPGKTLPPARLIPLSRRTSTSSPRTGKALSTARSTTPQYGTRCGTPSSRSMAPMGTSTLSRRTNRTVTTPLTGAISRPDGSSNTPTHHRAARIRRGVVCPPFAHNCVQTTGNEARTSHQ